MTSIIEGNHRDMVSILTKDPEKIKAEMTVEKWGSLALTVEKFIQIGLDLDQMKKVCMHNKSGISMEFKPARIPVMNSRQYHLLHMAIGIAGESAEILSAIMDYGTLGTLDIENVIEEFGDMEFYMEGLRNSLNIGRIQTLEYNLHKLVNADNARYKGGEYSDEAAQTRADKEDEP